MKSKLFFAIIFTSILVIDVAIGDDKPYTKLSPYTQIIVNKEKEKIKLRTNPFDTVFISAFVKVKDEKVWEKLAKLNCRITTKQEGIATVKIPSFLIDSIANISEIEYIEASRPLKPLLDAAQKLTQVIPAQEGNNITLPYTGDGVIVGVVDLGIEYVHPTFYSADGTRLRVKKVWDQNAVKGNEYLNSPGAIINAKYSIDSYANAHGTHVAGIAAGSGYGTPYKGIAYNSDLILVPTTATNDDIISGINYIIQEAKKENKPCVINISLGDNIGPHDGSALFDTMIDRLCTPGNIIVAAAGNSKHEKKYATLATVADTLKTFIQNNGFEYGMIDSWGDIPGYDFSICLELYNKKENRIVSSTGFINSRNFRNSNFTFFSSDNQQYYTINMAAQKYVYNNKYNILTQIIYPKNRNSEEYILLKVTSSKTTVKVWNDFSTNFTDLDKGFPYKNGSGDFSLCSPASAHNVIAVGAYVSSRVKIDESGKIVYMSSQNVGDLSYFSSTGPTIDNRIKPEITAPGDIITSAYNSYYLTRDGKRDTVLLMKQTLFDGKKYPWGIMRGTSMAAPYVTGTIALWLQANPTLSADDIKKIFAKTAIQSKDEIYPNEKWGYGKINVYNGLLNVLGIDIAHENIFEQSTDEAVCVYSTPEKNKLYFRFLNTPKPFDVYIYDQSGMAIAHFAETNPENCNYEYSLPTLPVSSVIVQIETSGKKIIRKIAL